MEILSQNNQDNIKYKCDQCGQEINNALLNQVIKLTYGNIKNNLFSGKEVRYYHVECIIN